MIRDPQGVEGRVLKTLAPFSGQRVLEVGCGDGRVTWRYAAEAARVTAIDPNPDVIERARAARPQGLAGHVDLLVAGIEQFDLPDGHPGYDIVLFTKSL